MSQALPGQHLCQHHQGNHSHYAPDNCVICRAEQLAARLTHFGDYCNDLDDLIPEPAEIKRLANELLTLIREQR